MSLLEFCVAALWFNLAGWVFILVATAAWRLSRRS